MDAESKCSFATYRISAKMNCAPVQLCALVLFILVVCECQWLEPSQNPHSGQKQMPAVSASRGGRHPALVRNLARRRRMLVLLRRRRLRVRKFCRRTYWRSPLCRRAQTGDAERCFGWGCEEVESWIDWVMMAPDMQKSRLAFEECTANSYLACSAMDDRWGDADLRLLNCLQELKTNCSSQYNHYNVEQPQTDLSKYVCSPSRLSRCVYPCWKEFDVAKLKFNQWDFESSPHSIWARLHGHTVSEYTHTHTLSDHTFKKIMQFNMYHFHDERLIEAKRRMESALQCLNGTGKWANDWNCHRLLCDKPRPPAPAHEPYVGPSLADWQLYLRHAVPRRQLFTHCPECDVCALAALANCTTAAAREMSGQPLFSHGPLLRTRLTECYGTWIDKCNAYRHLGEEAVPTDDDYCHEDEEGQQSWSQFHSLPSMLIKASRLREDLWREFRPYLADAMAIISLRDHVWRQTREKYPKKCGDPATSIQLHVYSYINSYDNNPELYSEVPGQNAAKWICALLVCAPGDPSPDCNPQC